jgi:hypothetical protein
MTHLPLKVRVMVDALVSELPKFVGQRLVLFTDHTSVP